MKKVIVILVAFPILWLAYRVYGLSIRYGTSNPCDMIAERLTAETFRSVDPVGLDPLLKRERPYELAREKDRVREHGAWACWKSVLFDMPTQIEVTHAVVMEAHDIERRWRDWKRDGDDDARFYAVFQTEKASIDVLEQLLVMGKEEIIRAGLDDELSHVSEGYNLGQKAHREFHQKVEAAVADHCKFGRWLPNEDRDSCVARYSTVFGLPSSPK